MNTRRQFLITAPLGALGATVACRKEQAGAPVPGPTATPGAPPTFGTAAAAGPAVSPSTFAEAEKLARVTMTEAERQLAASNWQRSMAPLVERRVGPRKISLEPTLPPATQWNPVVAGHGDVPARDVFVRSTHEAVPLPASDELIAFAPVTDLSRWIERKALSCERLTNIYLRRIEEFDARLRSVITLTRDAAIAQAKRADAEIAAGRYRGPLHGVPFGVKDSRRHRGDCDDVRRRALQKSRPGCRLRRRAPVD